MIDLEEVVEYIQEMRSDLELSILNDSKRRLCSTSRALNSQMQHSMDNTSLQSLQEYKIHLEKFQASLVKIQR